MADGVRLSGDLGLLRLAAGTPELRVADVDANVKAIVDMAGRAAAAGAQVLTLPEMSITGYTVGDLVLQKALLSAARAGVARIAEETASSGVLVIVGLPLEVGDRVFNVAAAICRGKIIGAVPKTYLPSYREFYETRWFASGLDPAVLTTEIGGHAVPLGPDLLFSVAGLPGAVIGIEICEDLWVPLAPHEHQAISGATVLLNLSASNDIIGKTDWRRTMVVSESGRCLAAYCYVSSGPGESTIDVVFGGHTVIAENGVVLRETDRLSDSDDLVIADIDIERLIHDRRMTSSFRDAPRPPKEPRILPAAVHDPPAGDLQRPVDPHPFVPSDAGFRSQRCQEIFSMQTGALAGKMRGAGIDHIVVGTSGGLDSTLALLAAVKTADHLSIARTNVHAFSMPGFGTTDRTRKNAGELCRSLGVGFAEVDISAAGKLHLEDLGHDGTEDTVFENVQARYRTEFLFNKANELGALLLGTGDLTEVALGWCTFSGDQISHYHVNVSVPKTLVKYLVRWVADEEFAGAPAQAVLYDILDTPISPELKRPRNGRISQETEQLVGPLELSDFFLYPFIRWGTRPGKVLYLADQVRLRGGFDRKYRTEELHAWFRRFLERFFANQFKRTCMPEGPKIGSVSLSPRGDWRMPSDASAKLWLEDLETMAARLEKRS